MRAALATMRPCGTLLRRRSSSPIASDSAPPSVAHELARLAQAHDFLLLRTDHYLAPNEARNLALPYLESDFVAFVDDDLRFEPGWVERLVQCAEDTGAWLVSPVIIQEGAYGTAIHMVGGSCEIRSDDGTTRFHETHEFMGRPLDEMPALTRRPTGMVEFHIVLVTRPALDAVLPLDEGLLSTRDHCDLTLQAKERGGEIWLEPSVTITQMELPARLPRIDRGYYALRWCDAWNRAALARFREKWGLDPSDPLEAHDLVWLSVHRLYGNRGYGGLAGTLPSRPRRAAIRVADRVTQTMINLRRPTHTRRAPPPRVVHAPKWCRGAERVLGD